MGILFLVNNKKNGVLSRHIFYCAIFLILIGVGYDLYGHEGENWDGMVSNLDIRPNVKRYLDELSAFHLVHVGHTTDSISIKLIKRLPKDPRTFDAGRFKVVFRKGGEVKAIIVQTESAVGHYAKVVPGKTAVDGYIQLNADPKGEGAYGPKLEPKEVDYFIRIIYSKFRVPLEAEEAKRLDNLKDMALAIMFNSKTGINKYHLELLKQLKFRM